MITVLRVLLKSKIRKNKEFVKESSKRYNLNRKKKREMKGKLIYIYIQNLKRPTR